MHFVGFGFEPAEKTADAVPVARVPQFGEFSGGAVLAFENKFLVSG
jgi:hypothetical protein